MGLVVIRSVYEAVFCGVDVDGGLGGGIYSESALD